MKTKIEAKVVADSTDSRGNRLTSLVLTYPRIIHSEMMTHRMFSRNASSSRAVPVDKMIKAVRENTFCPFEFQKSHKGMQGSEYFTGAERQECINLWIESAELALQQAEKMKAKGISKQIINRILEPYQYYTVLITGSKEGWDNFFELRCPQYSFDNVKFYKSRKEAALDIWGKEQPDNPEDNIDSLGWFRVNRGQAEIHMMALAEAIYDAMNESIPKQLKAGDWHVPFEDKLNEDKVAELYYEVINNDRAYNHISSIEETKVKISTAMAARTSYTVVGDEKEIDYQKMIKLHDRLIAQDPPHCFTEGTEILTKKGWIDLKEINDDSEIASVNISDLRFNGFEKPDNIIKEDYNGTVYELPQGGISISPNHILLGNIISKSSDRTKSYTDVTKIFPTYKGLNTRKINIFREMRMFSACNPQHGKDKLSILYLTGVLYGFFIGDGSCKHKNVYFHLKKERKIKFLEDLLLSLGRTYSITDYKDGTVNFIINEDTNVFTKFYDLDGNKIIPYFLPCDNILFLNGLFEGLKISDGSIKRNTWVYDTSSKPLHDRILELCPLIGLTGISYDTYDHFRIGFTTDNNVLVNDSRKPDSKVIEKEYSGKLYCVEIPSKGIIVRKNGKVLITHNSSPMEHCARVMSDEEYMCNVKGQLDMIDMDKPGSIYIADLQVYEDSKSSGWSRNFKGFIPYRHFIES